MVTTDGVVGGFPVLMWVLWGGLAVFFCGLYAGVYIWMRRPRFGEGEGEHSTTTALPDAAVDQPAEVRVAEGAIVTPGPGGACRVAGSA